MRLGAIISRVDGSDPLAILHQARAFEGEGYDSIWSVQATGRGFMMSDPFVALTAAASVTTTVEIGTAVLQLPLYNPTDIALKVFSLAQLSGNRFVLGVGAGSTPADYTIHGADFDSRFKRFEESLSALRKILQSGIAAGIDLDPWDSVPGKTPLCFGTWGKQVERAATEFDGWIASAMHRTVDECEAAIRRYRAAGGGRAIVSTILVSRGQDLGELRERLVRFSEAGFDDAVVLFLPGSPDHASVRNLVN